jgi:hypothetical protein
MEVDEPPGSFFSMSGRIEMSLDHAEAPSLFPLPGNPENEKLLRPFTGRVINLLK